MTLMKLLKRSTVYSSLILQYLRKCSPEVESRTQHSSPRTQKNFEAKDTDARVLQKKGSSKNFFRRSQKKGLQKIFSGEKGLQKFFSGNLHLRKPKKKVFADFPQGFWRFPTKFQRFKK